MDFYDINIYTLKLTHPVYSLKELFISNLFDENNNIINIKNKKFKLLHVNDNSLFLEFIPSSNLLYKFILELDKYIKEQIINNAEEWFENKVNNDTINNLYKSSINLPDTIPDALPNMKFNLSNNCKIIQENKKIDISELKQNTIIKIDFSIIGLYFFKNKCHLEYIVNKINIDE